MTIRAGDDNDMAKAQFNARPTTPRNRANQSEHPPARGLLRMSTWKPAAHSRVITGYYLLPQLLAGEASSSTGGLPQLALRGIRPHQHWGFAKGRVFSQW